MTDIPYGYEKISDLCRSIFGMYKLKYKVLDNFDFGKIDAFHINCESIINAYKKYYSSNPELADTDLTYTITSSIINMVAHYTHYFAKRNMKPTIYLYMVSPEYVKDLKNARSLVSIICRYIPKTYCIVTPYDYGHIYIDYFCKKHKSNLVLTKNVIDLLLVSDNVSVIKSNKDNSVYYNSNNLYSNYLKREYSGKLSCKLLPIVFSFTAPGKHMTKIKKYGPSKVIKLLDKALNENLIVNSSYNNMKHFLQDIKPLYEPDKEDMDKLISNFKTIDINYLEKNLMTKGAKERLGDCIVDKFANSDLAELNIKYFTGFNSLMLDYLFEGRQSNTHHIKW